MENRATESGKQTAAPSQVQTLPGRQLCASQTPEKT